MFSDCETEPGSVGVFKTVSISWWFDCNNKSPMNADESDVIKK